MSNVPAKTKNLESLAAALTASFNDGEKIYIKWCSLLGEARDAFDDDDDFWVWVEEQTPFKKNIAYQYLQVQKEVVDVFANSQQDAIKAMPFSSLQAIAKQKLPKTVKNKVVNSYGKHLKNPTKHAKPTTADVKRIISGVMPPKAPKREPQVITRPAFAHRLARCVAGKATNPFYLFCLLPEAHYTDAEIMVKHWKGKYHPDKGGSNAEFNTINELGNALVTKLKGSKVL